MNNTNEPVGSEKGLSTLQRARFGPGMLLQHEDLELLNTYTRDLSRLLFQSFFGCGVVCGLVVRGVPHCDELKVTVEPGLALSCSGDPVYVPGPKAVEVFTKKGFDIKPVKDLWVVLCGTTKCCAPRTSSCSSDDDEATSDCTREKDGFEIKLMLTRPDCACSCPPAAPKAQTQTGTTRPTLDGENPCKCADITCHEDHYAGVCGCTCGECSGCDCKCILLARLSRNQDGTWKQDHSVRRFIRPVLMRDPQPIKDKEAVTNAEMDPTATSMFDFLSDVNSEKEMIGLRETHKRFPLEGRVMLSQIVTLYPERDRPKVFQEILTKYRGEMLASNLSSQSLISRLNQDLDFAKAQAKKGKTSAVRSRKPKET